MGDLISDARNRLMGKRIQKTLSEVYAEAEKAITGVVVNSSRISAGGQTYKMQGGSNLTTGDLVTVKNIQRSSDPIYTPTVGGGGTVSGSGGGAGSSSEVPADAVPSSRQILTGTGLAGGGDLSSDRTIDLVYSDTPTAITPAASSAQGVSSYPARVDHAHGVSVASAIVLGTVAGAGAAASLLRSDATIVAFDATVPTTLAHNSAATVGTIAYAARRDHIHAITASATPGVAASLLKTDAAGLLTLVSIAATNADFANATIRGELKTTILSYGQISATNGALIVTPSAGKLLVACTSVDDASTFAVDIKDAEGLSHAASGALWTAHATTGDVIRLQEASGGGVMALWGRVTAKSDQTTFWRLTVKKLLPAAGTNYTFPAGAAVLNYGQSGKGNIVLTAEGAVFLEVSTHAGAPQTTQTRRARIGDLTGLAGVTGTEYGLWTDNGFFTGTIRLGATPPTDSSHGTGLFADASGLYGLSSDVRQAYFGSDGKFYGGGGSIRVSASGIDMIAEGMFTASTRLAFRYGSTFGNNYSVDATYNQAGRLYSDVGSYGGNDVQYFQGTILEGSAIKYSYISLVTGLPVYRETAGSARLSAVNLMTAGKDIDFTVTTAEFTTPYAPAAILTMPTGAAFRTRVNGVDVAVINGTNTTLAALSVTGAATVGTTLGVTGQLTVAASTTNSSIKVGGFEIQSYAVNNCWMGNNFYYNGSAFKYRAAGYAHQQYYLPSGGFALRTAPSGNAGDSITFSYRQVIQNAGDFGLGGSITSDTNLTGATIAGVSGKFGINTITPAAQCAINGGLHVGGDSDPGDNNVLIDGTLSVGTSITTGGHSNTITTEQISVTENGTTTFAQVNGFLFISDSAGHSAIYMANGSNSVTCLVNGNGFFTSVINTDNTTNIYTSGSSLVAQNKLHAGTITYSIWYLTK